MDVTPCIRLKLTSVIVEDSIASLNVAVTPEFKARPVEELAGTVELTVGATVSVAVADVVLLLPPHPATKITSSNAMNRPSGRAKFSILFICFSLGSAGKASILSTNFIPAFRPVCYANGRE
jgi:hypothetical protein